MLSGCGRHQQIAPFSYMTGSYTEDVSVLFSVVPDDRLREKGLRL